MAAPVGATLWRARSTPHGPGGPIAFAGGCADGRALDRAALRARLSRALLPVDTPPSAVRWPSGQAPQGPRPWRLSASHSGPWMVLAATPGGPSSDARCAIGVDVERLRPRNFAALERHLAWPGTSADDVHFYRRWTLAEACFKCGTGAPSPEPLRRTLFAALDRYSSGGDWGQDHCATLPAGAFASVGWWLPAPDLVVCAVGWWEPARAGTGGAASATVAGMKSRNE